MLPVPYTYCLYVCIVYTCALCTRITKEVKQRHWAWHGHVVQVNKTRRGMKSDLCLLFVFVHRKYVRFVCTYGGRGETETLGTAEPCRTGEQHQGPVSWRPTTVK